MFKAKTSLGYCPFFKVLFSFVKYISIYIYIFFFKVEKENCSFDISQDTELHNTSLVQMLLVSGLVLKGGQEKCFFPAQGNKNVLENLLYKE